MFLFPAPRRLCAPSFVLLMASLLLAAPDAHAGTWQFTCTGSGSETEDTRTPTIDNTQTQNWVPPGPSTGSCQISGFSVTTQPGAFSTTQAGTTKSGGGSISAAVTLTWVHGTGQTDANDPAPTSVLLKESSSASWTALVDHYPDPYITGGTSADDGLGDAEVATYYSGVKNGGTSSSASPHYTVKSLTGGTLTLNRSFSAHATASAGPSDAGICFGFSFGNYTVSVDPVPATLTVDQDQQIFAPAATTRLSATVGNLGNFTLDWVKISVDGGTPTAATVNPNNPNSYYIDWPQSGGNPSEHSVVATAQIHNAQQTLKMDSSYAPNRVYAPSGMGRAADDIIADVRPQSLKFSGNIALNRDAVTPVPTPEFTWSAGNSSPATSNPAAYVQGQKVNATLTLGSSAGAALTGSATLGYGLKLQATPNTTNPAANQADPVLTLCDNTTSSPFTPTSCGSSVSIAATTALNSWVSTYSLSFSPLTLYVEFTKLPTPVWVSLGSYPSGNTLYAVVATPTAPMATPWVPVLDKACNWARRTSDATSATTAIAKTMYNAFTYYGNTTHTVRPTPDVDGVETFSVLGFLSDKQGDCRDFADFLVSSSNAIGAKNLQSQRSDTVANIDRGQVEFRTKNFIAAPYQQQAVPSSNSWVFHQWSVADNVYDACLGTTPTPLVNLPLSTYFSTLVDQTLPYKWNPQAAFTPTLSN